MRLPHPLRVIGILGGVGSGKSAVAQMLVDLGAELLDGDRTGHEVLQDPEVVAAVTARWGPAVLGPAGEIDRSAVARRVFAPTSQGAEDLSYLEQLTHPRIKIRLQRRLEQMRAAGQVKAVILDAPVLLKAGWRGLCDQILFVDAPRDLRLARAQTRGWSEKDFEAREAAQESLAEKRRHADVIIDNSGTLTATRRQVEQYWHSLT